MFSEFKEKVESSLWAQVYMEPIVGLKSADGTEPYSTIDAFVRMHNFKAIGSAWDEITEECASQTLQRILSKSLAYGTDIFDIEVSRELALKFVALFSAPRHWFTNMSAMETNADWSAIAGTPITDHTFDWAVVGLDSKNIGIVCAMDED